MEMYSVRVRPDVGSLVKTMDRWLLIAACFFMTTEVFTLVALVSPNWITSSDDSSNPLGRVCVCTSSGVLFVCVQGTWYQSTPAWCILSCTWKHQLIFMSLAWKSLCDA